MTEEQLRAEQQAAAQEGFQFVELDEALDGEVVVASVAGPVVRDARSFAEVLADHEAQIEHRATDHPEQTCDDECGWDGQVDGYAEEDGAWA